MRGYEVRLIVNESDSLKCLSKQIFSFIFSGDLRIHLSLDDEIDRKIDDTAIQFLLVQNNNKHVTES